MSTNTNKIRLHLPAIPYTITSDLYSHDAFTGKVKRFSPMIKSRGFEVFHYGVESSDSGADKNIDLLTKKEWNELRIKTFMFIEPGLTLEDAIKKNDDPTYLINGLSNWSSPLTKEFNRRFRIKLLENYRSTETDIVCLPLGRTYEDAISDLNLVKVETGIGYSGSYQNYRVFESYNYMALTLGKEDKNPPNYWFVIPYFFDINSFKLSLTPTPKKVGFFGRITSLKGCNVIVEIARRFPDIQFVLCGQGDPAPYLKEPNVVYKPPIHGEERSEFLGSCIAVLCPSAYAEPFCAVAVEAQLCGTPVICSDHGGFIETVEMFRTGLRCHTLADYCSGVQMALDNKFDRTYIRERSANLFDMYKLAYNYEYVLKTILDVHKPGVRGWYADKSHIDALNPIKPNSLSLTSVEENIKFLIEEKPIIKQRIYLIIVYYGKFPNYFQLYLDSLEINKDILSVILISDISLAPYKVPSNLIHVNINIDDVRERITLLLFETYQQVVLPLQETLLTTNYKLVDFKIVYPLLFKDILVNNNVSSNDFIGWGDCDVIYGKLSNFIDFKENYDIIGGWHGHFTAIKNTESFKNLYKNIPNYFELVTDNTRTYITDEIAYREPLKEYLIKNRLKMFYINANFCDIIPECFYGMFRPDWKERSKNFFNNSHPEKNINHLFFDKIHEKLITIYDDGQSYENTYCHLQKRKMELPFNEYKTGYYINENNFSLKRNQNPIKNKGISFMIRVRNEEETLESCIRSLFELTIPYEIIVILHLCNDKSEKIVLNLQKENNRIKIYKYDIHTSRAGYETFATDVDSKHSFITYTNWCLQKLSYSWLFKWDADFIASPKLIEFLNTKIWEDQNISYKIAAINNTSINKEFYLINDVLNYGKQLFWEVPVFNSINKQIELDNSIYITHNSQISNLKKYWVDKNKWYENEETEESTIVKNKLSKLVEEFGEEPDGFARAADYSKNKLHLDIFNKFKNYSNYDDYFNDVNNKKNQIPLNIFQTWKTLELPSNMKKNVELLKKNNPEFKHYLFDDSMCREFIVEHFKFNQDIVDAYDKLKPGAYKADLWRYCILYIHGGVYLDIKVKFCNEYKLNKFIDKEYFVSDGKYTDENNIQKQSIYNGFMVCEKKSEILIKCINNIISNVKNEYYGITPWDVTGPRLLGHYYEKYYKNDKLILTHNNCEIKINFDEIVLDFYKEYSEEKFALCGGSKENYYYDMWKNKNIYKNHITNTIITYCSGYRYEVFRRFAGTLFDTGFNGNLIFVIKKCDLEHLKQLMETYKNVTYYMDDNENNSRYCPQKRYYIYQNILKNLKTDYVLLCDSRDLFFQKNIEWYPIDKNIDLYFFEEGLNINNCNTNKDWLKFIEKELNMKENDIISQVQDKKIICSGTTYGKLNGIKIYVDRMCDLMTNKIRSNPEMGGLDQGIHNYLIYIEGFQNMKTKHLKNEDNLVNTLQYANYKFMNEFNQIINIHKEPSYIVHQWDRLPDYMTERLCAKYDFSNGN
jgi:mannosyltransferase OCH1-like enzyme